MPLLDRELSLALVEALFQDGPIAVALLDADLRYVRVSERYAEITGTRPDDHVGRTPWEVVPEIASEVLGHMQRALAESEPGHGPVTGETPAQPGVPRTWQSSWYPVREGEGTVGVAALVVETTEVTRLTEQRARLFARANQALTRAREAERREAFLTEAHTLLAGTSLDLTATLRALSRTVVPRLADLCIVDMLAADGGLRRLAVTHRDPVAEQLVWELTRRWPNDRNAQIGIRRAMQTGEAEHVADISESVLAQAFPDPAYRTAVRPLDLRAALIVPLAARGHVLGVITFVRVGTGGAFDDPDVSLACDLARRAAVLVDNARLHTDLRRAGRDARFLAEASRLLAASLDFGTTAQTVTRLATQGIADGCAVELLEPTGELRTVAVDHVVPAKRETAGAMRARWPGERGVSTVARAIESGRAELVPVFDPERSDHLSPDQVVWLRDFGLRSVIVVPLVARGRALGALLLAVTESARSFSEEDLALAEELGRRVAVAADNARLYSERSRVAQTLQRSLVPAALPDVPGLDLAVRFRAAGDGGEVGGDFYDVWTLPDGRWGAIVGDVCGKGAGAAAFTALARHTVRAASRYERGPVGVLAMLDRTLSEQAEDGQFCTAAHGWLERREEGFRFRHANGGHLPPLVVRAGGRVDALEASGALLGVWGAPTLEERETLLLPGDVLVLYTDGVTEVGAPGDPFGEARLAELLAGLAGADPDTVVSKMLRAAVAHRPEPPRDDIAVLALAVRSA